MVLLGALVTLGLVACTPPPAPGPLALKPMTPGVMVVGLYSPDATVWSDQQPGPQDLNLWAVYSDGSYWEVSQLAMWAMSGTGGSTVSNSGQRGVVTYGSGHNLVTATYGGFTRNIDVWGLMTGLPATGNVERIEVRTNAIGFPGQPVTNQFAFSATAYADDPDVGANPVDITTDPATTWSTSTPSIVTVDSSGVAIPTGTPGVAVVTATNNGHSASAYWFVLDGLRIWAQSPFDTTRHTATLVAHQLDVATSNDVQLFPPDITWHSSNPAVATVDSSGTITAVGTGTTDITATYGTSTSNVLRFSV